MPNYARDLLYLIKNGDRRHWDCFLLHEPGSTRRPVFKSFRRLILFPQTDCHGVTSPASPTRQTMCGAAECDSGVAGTTDRLAQLADSSGSARRPADSTASPSILRMPDTGASARLAWGATGHLVSGQSDPTARVPA
jgi:hypothetical protein